MKLKLADGFKIRNTIDVEFGVIGDHSLYPFIPKGEVWLERDYVPEQKFILDLYRRKMALAKRYGYERAKAKLRPKRVDRRAVRLCPRLGLGRVGRTGVFLVDGSFVRRRLDPNFCFGGHYLVYDYVPAGQVWLDDAAEDAELKYIAVHELFELFLMQAGKDYTNAHDFANAAEKEARRADGIAHYPKD